MRQITRVLTSILLIQATSCVSLNRACQGNVERAVVRFSGGPAPAAIVTLEAYANGCVHYSSEHDKKCICQGTAALQQLLSDDEMDRVTGSMRISPRRWVDSEGVMVRFRAIATARAARDLPKNVREWLSAVDAEAQRYIGASYVPLLNNRL
jgi:hypothetical protein